MLHLAIIPEVKAQISIDFQPCYFQPCYYNQSNRGNSSYIISEEKDDVEITISSWKTKEDVEAWRKDPLHMEAKARANEWYHWVKGIHVETVDE